MANRTSRTLNVIINEQPVYRIVCTKDHLRELVTGRMVTDGIIKKKDEIYNIFFCKYENEARIVIGIYVNKSRAERYVFVEIIARQKVQEKARTMFEQTADALAGAIDAKNTYTNGHSRRVAQYSLAIAK